MRNTVKWNSLIITCIICLAPILLGIALWDKLPDSMAIHFDINNNPDNFAPKWFAVFGLPVLMVALQIICCVTNDIKAKANGNIKKLEIVLKAIIPCITVILYIVTLVYSLGVMIDIRLIAMLIVGTVLILTGNYLPKLNYVKNRKIDKEKARKINRFVGFVTVIMGALALITIFLKPITSVIWLFMLILYVLLSLIYTAVILKKTKGDV